MNKRFITIAATLFCSLLPAIAHAESTPITTLEELQNIANTGGEAVLQADITMTSDVIVNNDLILDFNGHTIINTTTDSTIDSLANLTFKDSSASKSGKYLVPNGNGWAMYCGYSNKKGNCTIEDITIESKEYGALVYGDFTMNSGIMKMNYFGVAAVGATHVNMNGGYIESIEGPTIKLQGTGQFVMNGGRLNLTTEAGNSLVLDDGATGIINDGEIDAMYRESDNNGGTAVTLFNDSTVYIHGGTFKAYSHTVATNGTTESGRQDGRNAKIYIYGGTFTSEIGDCLYLPSANGVTEIYGGNFTSKNTALEIRAGSLYIKDGVFISTADSYSVQSNRSGSTTIGAALAVAQHRTMQPIGFEICGGNFHGPVAFSEANPEGNPPESVNQIQIIITRTCSEPIFESDTEDTVIVENVSNFIEGGTFSNDIPEDYIVPGSGKKDETGKIIVYPVRKITVAESEGGKIAVSAEQGLYGDIITVTNEANPSYFLEKLIVKGNTSGKEYPVESIAEFSMPDEDITVIGVFNVINPATDDEFENYVKIFFASVTVLQLAYFVRKS